MFVIWFGISLDVPKEHGLVYIDTHFSYTSYTTPMWQSTWHFVKKKIWLNPSLWTFCLYFHKERKKNQQTRLLKHLHTTTTTTMFGTFLIYGKQNTTENNQNKTFENTNLNLSITYQSLNKVSLSIVRSFFLSP